MPEAFDIVSSGHARNRAVARFTCKCGGKIEVSLGGPGRLNPEALANVIKQRGWAADAFRPSATKCPSCRRKRRKNDPDSEIKKIMTTKSPSLTPAPVLKAAPPAEATAIQPRPLTQDQRLAVRNLLDEHFDDSKGIYLDGMTDQAIADRAKVPRVHVESIREAAYGPIRVDPELIQARASLETVLRDARSAVGRIEEYIATIDKLIQRKAA